jgi:tRNA threonylcarbamoyladenosine biosynthesis protein TsaE
MANKYISKGEQETEKIASKLAKEMKGGEVIALTGNLGAGKTVFVRGLAKAFAIKRPITSPSFVLMKIYRIKNRKFGIKNFLHIDAYRLKNEKDLINIGILDWLNKKDTITVIEWADRIKNILPKETVKIKINFGKKENERIISRH